MRFKFFIDYLSGRPHIQRHDVMPDQIFEFFSRIDYFEEKRVDGSYTAYGKLNSGRYLKVVYRKINPSELFIITAYDLEDEVYIQLIDRHIDENN